MGAARSVGGFLQCACLVFYIACWKRCAHLVWRLSPASGGWRAVVHGPSLRRFILVSAPSAIIMWSEWWSFEVLSLEVGLLPNATIALGAHGTMFNIAAISYMTYTGLGAALCAILPM